MNLKESFRYQNFLDGMLRSAGRSIESSEHCLKVTRTHLRSKVNHEAEDMEELVEVDDFFPNDEVIAFLIWLVSEREKLTKAIGAAKASIPFDIDAAVETNKFRQNASSAIKAMLSVTPSKRMGQGRDYKFNLEGNQMPYVYDIEIVSEDAYDRASAKAHMRSMISEADKTSAAIDAALINTVVDYVSVFDVNESFEDVMADFVEKILKAE